MAVVGKPPGWKPATQPKAAGPDLSLVGFARQVLAKLGLPTTAANVNYVVAWANREGGGGANNPLNTTLQLPGSTPLSGNSAGVQNFTSFAQGVDATARTLSASNYADIRGMLASGKANPNAVLHGLGTWSGGGYTSLSGVAATNRAVSGSGASGPNTSAQNLSFGQGDTTQSTSDLFASNPDLVGAKGEYNYANQTYGYLGAFLHDKQIGPILVKAADEGWDSNRLFGALQKTPWWQHTAASARQFDADASLDPATHQQKIANQQSAITSLAASMGVTVSPARLAKMASDSLRLGWSSDMLRQAVAAEFHYNPAQAGGINQTTAQLKQIAYDYAIPLSDQAVGKWAQQILAGGTLDDFKAYAIQQAQGLYPTIAGSVNENMNVQTFADPYKQQAAKILGVNPDSIDLSDPKWNSALATVDPATGKRVPMTLDQWTTTMRTDPRYGWDGSQDARDTANTLLASIKSQAGV